jgi:alpha-L-rhamnosidase
MKAFLAYLESTHRDFIRCYPDYDGFRGFGDWLSINAETPHDLIGTAFLAYSAKLLAQIADVLGHPSDQAHYEDVFKSARQAFQNRYVTPDGLLAPPTQTAYLLALHFDLLPEHQRARAAQELVDDIGRRGWHISAGFVGSSYVNPVLTAIGRPDVAYKLLFQKTWPSWLYPVTKGATTIWERWDGWTEEKGFQDAGMNSFNHYAYGAIGMWLYQSVAGIDMGAPGYKKIVLKPVPGDGLTWAKAHLDSVHGRIESAWTNEAGRFVWDVVVPPNTTAVAYVPVSEGRSATASEGAIGQGVTDEYAAFSLASGRYHFES